MTQIKLEVGKRYRNREGEIVEIRKYDGAWQDPYSDGSKSYYPDGRFSIPGFDHWDLVEEVIEPAKKPHKLSDDLADAAGILAAWGHSELSERLLRESEAISRCVKLEPKPGVVKRYLYLHSEPEVITINIRVG